MCACWKCTEGPNAPDFIAVDRYEADDFTIRSYANGYCYWTHEWQRTLRLLRVR